MKLTINELTDMLFTDNLWNSKKTCHLSNDILVRMCDMLDQDQEINVETTRSNNMVNRGSTFEILFKMLLNKRFNLNLNTNKSQANQQDLNTNELGQALCEMLGLPMQELEIKFSTSFANASKIINTNVKSVLVANQKGVYIGNVKDLNTDKKGHIKPTQPKFKRLEMLSQIMGY